jgi:hypothetical protein
VAAIAAGDLFDSLLERCVRFRRPLDRSTTAAEEWRIDKERIGGCGGSAGGFTALWLGFAPDMADPRSADPVSRESTRLRWVMTFVPQSSLDPKQAQAWIPNNEYGNHAFGLPSMTDFIAEKLKAGS